MGILSSIFNRNQGQKDLEEAFNQIRKILNDEKVQLELIHPAIRDTIKSCPAYDRDPNGTGPFGFCDTNPIPVNGPVGQLAYLSKLETNRGERILFHRLGAVKKIDVFEAVSFSGSEWFILFTDFYHPRKSKLTPDGFRFTQEVAQLSGFHKFCPNFPYDFVEMKKKEMDSALGFAYIAISKVSDQISKRAFERPLAHRAKLDLVKGHLTSSLSQ